MTDLGAINFRHHPIQDRKAGPIFCLEDFERLKTVVGRHNFVSPTGKQSTQQFAGDAVVICDQHLG